MIDYSADDLKARLADEAPGGIDVVYDPVGGDHAQTAVRALCWGGRYLTVGYASGDIPKVGMNRLLVSGGALHGVLWGRGPSAPRAQRREHASAVRLVRPRRPPSTRQRDLSAGGRSRGAGRGDGPPRARQGRSHEWKELTDGPVAEPGSPDIVKRLEAFMDEYVYPAEPVYAEQLEASGPRSHVLPPIVEELKAEARRQGMWNLFLPALSGLTHLDSPTSPR